MAVAKRSSKPIVSVIVPIRRGEDISLLLDGLTKQRFTNFETIIVDEGKERSEQRNVGIRKAKGKYLLILDSDQIPSIYLIKDCVGRIESFSYDALYIPERMYYKDWFSRLRDWERQFYTATPIDVVRFVKRKNCPYFNESLHGPEDSDWDRRINGRRGVSASYVLHADRCGPITFLKKKAYYSRSMSKYESLHPSDKVTNFWWRCFGVFLEDGKWKRFLASPCKATGVMIMVFLRGVIYLWNK